ncbi:SafA/ExsA family spore coat assembly protein [Bacillus sp. FJAT-29790]|uniref:SafA/ExsA family spore coat assembly protein n=1 Tax=Bacillus sp. FJAT-29790 TaxID=1895002 RepID=UPI001C24CAF1|nr:SafA/ExsA family spore coat assembly protein [Bacillus sp. FJAT-29790]
MKIHIVQKGDTLWKIAKKYGVNFEELKKMNTQLSNPDMIMPGMKIKIPGPGGSIKKEAPIGGVPEAKIHMGAKKEMPKAEHPFAKEKPITLPVVEAPKAMPVKEAPIVAPKEIPKALPKMVSPQMEMPKQLPKMVSPQMEIPKQLPKMVSPQMETPKQLPKMVSPQMEMPKQLPKMVSPQMETPKQLPKMVSPQAEMPVKPYAPKMPKPIMPEVDMSNYYMMNMANLAVQQPAPQLPPKPVNILPQVKPIAEEYPEYVESETFVHTQQGGYYQPMYPYQPSSLYPVSPAMPGPGFTGGYPQYQMPYPQVQAAETMPMQHVKGATMPMYQMPHQMPHYGMAGVESHGYMESSSHMPMHQMPHHMHHHMHHQMQHQMPLTSPAQAQMPAPVMGVEETQYQMPLQPTYTAPMMEQPYGYPCPPYEMIPVSPVMPGPGFCEPMPYEMPCGYPPMGVMPQVQGVMEEPMAQMPLMPTQSQMPLMPAQSQMPLMPTQSQMPLMPAQGVKGIEADCGCGGGMPPMGGYGPGFAPGPYGMGAAPYGPPAGFAPYANPYGYGPTGGYPFGMPRSIEESSEFDG